MTSIDEPSLSCASCGGAIPTEFDSAATLCPGCARDNEMDAAKDQHESEAERFALENCRITAHAEPYDPQYRQAPTPEEYEAGDRAAYTQNAWRTHVRHNCSNYDALIAGRSRDDPRDRVYYDAIRARIDELIDDYELEGELE